MPAKRKRDILDFDPNQSDPDDENFEPGQEREEKPRRVTKRSRSTKARSSGRRRDRYGGSDIDEDDDDLVSDSDPDEAFDDDDDEEDEDMPVNAGGRRTRKAAVKRQNYHESSDDESEEIEETPDEDEDEEDEDSSAPKRNKKALEKPKPSKIVTLKVPPGRGKVKEPPTPSVATRRTRAHTEEANEFLELSESGRHARTTRASTRSKSPEALGRATRATKGLKGLRKQPEPIEEATQENSAQERDQHDELMAGADAADDLAGEQPEGSGVKGEEEAERVMGDVPQETIEGDDQHVEKTAVGDADDDDDDDDVPVTRRTRGSRAAKPQLNEGNEEENENESEAAPSNMRKTRRSLRPKKALNEPSSDFEPGDDSGEGEGDVSASEASPKKGRRSRASQEDDGDEEFGTRGRRGTQGKRSANRRGSGDEDVELDQDELAEELEELRQSSRAARRRRRSPSITYEEPRTKRRRVTKPVDYSIKPLDQLVDQEEEDPAPSPAKGRRGGRNGASNVWQRNLASTYGPFGGAGGLGSLLGGPWGTGATGGVESDSSDDEAVAAVRPGIGGAVGMTPTTANAPALGPPLGALDGAGGVAATPNLGKVKNQKAFADADPLGVDLTVDFSKVGGLQGHIDQLKEMIMLPLLYPELFQRYKVTPPRGVLFHGPPGTGKTLLARALSNAVGIGGRKITFYMRKGADALSKWVGEAEKQLRLLFEEARRTQPSIIFFDEIDGLAPVRSSKQEQIHASIVSTLLALMDGMDGRGQVIVIGATNRPDSVDPALRRPGRFDREFYFPLPDVEGRRSIIDIHTKDWGLADDFKDSLARQTKGYGGADLRALCTEAALNSIQRTYPQIYSSTDKLIVDPNKVSIHATDFTIVMKKIIPSSQRSASSAAAPLPPSIEPLLSQQLGAIVKDLDEALPRKKKTTALEEAMFEPYDDDDNGFGRENLSQEFDRLRVFRPRLLIAGRPGNGQEYISAALLHHLEGVFVQNFDLATLLADGSPLEQVIVRLFTEVKRHKPAVIFIPNVGTWYTTMPPLAYSTFVTMLRSIPATDPVLLLATSEDDVKTVDEVLLRDLFTLSRKNRKEIETPSNHHRREYFGKLLPHIRMSPSDFPDPVNRKKRILEELPVAPPPPPRKPTKEEIEREMHNDHIALNHLKLSLQPIMDQIKMKYRKYRNSVIPEREIEYLWHEAEPGYVRADLAGDVADRPYVIDKDKDGVEGLRHVPTGKFFYNLDVATIEERLSNGFYARPIDFFKDIASLAADARNIGDRERTLKLNELVSNVRVDVHDVSTRLQAVDFEALYQRQQRRAKEAEEKRKKRQAANEAANIVQPDITSDITGPVVIGAPLPSGTTSARFRVMSPLANGSNDQSAAGSTSLQFSGLSNGNSVPSRPGNGDITMGGTDDNGQSQRFFQMGPPPKVNNPQTVSQVSLVGLPPGVSPSAVPNDASTTRSTDASGSNRISQHWDRLGSQHTNGTPTHDSKSGSSGQGNMSQMQDTQSLGGPSGPSQSQSTSNASPWLHSQAQAMAVGELQPRGSWGQSSNSGSGSGSHSTPGSAYVYGMQRTEQTSPTTPSHKRLMASAAQSSTRHTAPSMDNLLNDVSSPSAGGPRSSGQLSQHAVIDDHQVSVFLDNLVEQTSGCTVDQLEQINRELMEQLWSTRSEWNRNKVLIMLKATYNETIRDIEEMQGSFPNTQKTKSQSSVSDYEPR
ncbi:uncharacterized protein PgNI_09854 [Pyricularia grisea]|uniref:AAA+ ATPase domain-containing protein n=1 Tax=Pyricularia grisea TaxID=148305 RepID=A0A6P8ARZ0_PYRGI|nr:uncharacterized protein PgNI_09854 [Pyricularia grisea]TLD04899.1 hypothetical protein PgNI_09854 [Pyricularia grisea]